MGDFLKAAYQVLSEKTKPLSAKEIVELAIKMKILETKGSTPWQTMKSKLSTDILSRKDKSLFMRSDSGKFVLREWSKNYSEHVAPRFKKSLFDEDILVFKKEDLFKYIKKIGFNDSDINLSQLFKECFTMMRREAEENKNVIQLVSLYVIKYKNKYLTYKRTKRLPEQRLHGVYSIGFGGHLNYDDISTLFANNDDIENVLLWIKRELREELILEKEPEIKFRGLLYDNSREVSEQHIALVYDVFVSSMEYQIGERGFLMDPKFETLQEITKRINDFENWSEIIVKEELENGSK